MAMSRQVVGRKVKQLRRQRMVPGNVFGKDVKSTNIQIDEKALTNLVKQVGESGLVYLQIEGEKAERPAMIAEIRRDPVTGAVLHVGWHQVNLKEKVTAAIPVKLVGVAPAEEQKLGILVQQLHEMEIEALPADMPESVEVDISPLAEVDAAIYARDVKLDGKLTLKSDLEAIVVRIEPLAAEEKKEVPTEEVAPVEGEQPSSDQVPVPSPDTA